MTGYGEPDPKPTQKEMATALTAEMQADGVDIGAVALLDWLGICGYQLVEGDEASEAYNRAQGYSEHIHHHRALESWENDRGGT